MLLILNILSTFGSYMKSYLFEHIISFSVLVFFIELYGTTQSDLAKHLIVHIEIIKTFVIIISLKQLNILNNEQSEHEKYSYNEPTFAKQNGKTFISISFNPIKDSSILEQYTFTEHMINMIKESFIIFY